jgi:hypothetical protein
LTCINDSLARAAETSEHLSDAFLRRIRAHTIAAIVEDATCQQCLGFILGAL